MHGTLGSCAAMTTGDSHTCFVSKLYALINRMWMEERGVLAHCMPSVNMPFANEVAGGAAERQAVRDSLEFESSFSASPKTGKGKGGGGAELWEKKRRTG